MMSFRVTLYVCQSSAVKGQRQQTVVSDIYFLSFYFFVIILFSESLAILFKRLRLSSSFKNLYDMNCLQFCWWTVSKIHISELSSLNCLGPWTLQLRVHLQLFHSLNVIFHKWYHWRKKISGTKILCKPSTLIPASAALVSLISWQ